MAFQEGNFLSRRGNSLYYREYLPVTKPRAFLIFHHGYGAHAALADKAFERIKEAGIGLFAFDADSFGRSVRDEKTRSLVTHKDHMTDDVVTFVEEVVNKRQPNPKLPLFMGGHSMGGMVTILSALRHPELWQGILMTSPAVDVQRDFALRVLQFLQPLLLRVCPTARLIPAIPVEFATPIPEVRRQLKEDPLVDLGNIKLRMGVTFLDSWQEIAARERELKLPIYIAYSQTDKVVYAPAIERMLKNAQSTDVTVKRYEDAMHDLLLAPEEPAVTQGMIDWTLAHL